MSVVAEPAQRTRILALARSLMSEQGAHAMSMRQLATAADLNVATIYHYFPSKADLLRAVIEEKAYPDQLAAQVPVADADLGPRERLAELLRWLLREGVAEHETWKLLIGETLHGDATARQEALGLVEVLDLTLAAWLRDSFPEFDGDPDGTARVIRNHLVTCFVEDQIHDGLGRDARFAQRAADLAQVVFGG